MADIIVVDDHPLIRRGLLQILAREPDLRLVGEAETAKDALALVVQGCDLMLLDVALPDRDGLDLLEEIRTINPDLPVLVLSVSAEERQGVRALRAGAAGYVNKDSEPGVLIQAIRTVLAGKRYINHRLAEALAMELRTSGKPPHSTLSEREMQVLKALAEGRTLTAIAQDLGLSVKSVSTYRTRLLKKIGMGSNAEIARYAAQHGLVD